MRDHRLFEIDNLAVQPERDGHQVDQAGEVRHKDQAYPELTKERETAPSHSLDPVKQERKATTSHKPSSGSDNI
jgi:hypothetical protein